MKFHWVYDFRNPAVRAGIQMLVAERDLCYSAISATSLARDAWRHVENARANLDRKIETVTFCNIIGVFYVACYITEADC